jgi:hypothetical protein
MTKTTKKPVCVNLSRSLIDKIDQIRGDVSRSRTVERALDYQFGTEFETSEQEQPKIISDTIEVPE